MIFSLGWCVPVCLCVCVSIVWECVCVCRLKTCSVRQLTSCVRQSAVSSNQSVGFGSRVWSVVCALCRVVCSLCVCCVCVSSLVLHYIVA